MLAEDAIRKALEDFKSKNPEVESKAHATASA